MFTNKYRFDNIQFARIILQLQNKVERKNVNEQKTDLKFDMKR